MDYSLAALKLLCVQLKSARQTPSQSAMTLAGVLFQRACLQGILVSTASHGHDGDGCFLLDDGTGIIELSLSGEFRNHRWDIGMYVMVVGVFVFRTGKIPLIKVHKMVDLSPFPDREAVWYLEVIEAFKLFYQLPFEE
ncbi:uncharacterized protein LOC127799226 isoform X1 [Diospyros lotus]|uniref:uncharacterized protein LOC127799226 isoform X1 n=1 Tax=Diospyros lotus TaxID=55363 RepID=UPI0022555781|nr:uncharacterized protein LOC127799226 isoform X1 [Diospyros lotus]